MQLALYQPDIPQNLGSMLRLSACMDVPCHIIEPCGFILDDKRLKRVAMDYGALAEVIRHVSWPAFMQAIREQNKRIILLSTKAQKPYYDFEYQQDDVLLLGRESAGVPEEVALAVDSRVRIPLSSDARSLNLVQAATMVLGEALRQTRWMSS